MIHVFDSRRDMGIAAAHDIAERLRASIADQGRARVVFAAAASQADALDELAVAPGIDWGVVEAFHMDEYLGLDPADPAGFGNWLRRHLFDRVRPGHVHFIEPGEDPDQTARAYAEALASAPIDLVVCGIGANGHIAFNDPPVADFNDPLDVKVVELDLACRTQQVDDGAFPTVNDVPTHAITLTVPRLLNSGAMVCIVPGESKREAVTAALTGPETTACPASVLRRHPDITYYFDAEAGRDVRP